MTSGPITQPRPASSIPTTSTASTSQNWLVRVVSYKSLEHMIHFRFVLDQRFAVYYSSATTLTLFFLRLIFRNATLICLKS